MTDLRRVGPEAGLGGETLSTYVAVERTIFRSLHLRIVVSQVLLKIRQLDEGTPALG